MGGHFHNVKKFMGEGRALLNSSVELGSRFDNSVSFPKMPPPPPQPQPSTSHVQVINDQPLNACEVLPGWTQVIERQKGQHWVYGVVNAKNKSSCPANISHLWGLKCWRTVKEK